MPLETDVDLRAMAMSMVRRYTYGHDHHDDLVQVVHLALLRAADRFDPERGIPFDAYAWATGRGAVRRYFRDLSWPVRVPRSVEGVTARTLRHVASVEDAPWTVPAVPDSTGQVEARVMVSDLLSRLPDREQHIVKRTYFDGATQVEIAVEVGVSQMQVSRLLSQCLRVLRTWVVQPV